MKNDINSDLKLAYSLRKEGKYGEARCIYMHYHHKDLDKPIRFYKDYAVILRFLGESKFSLEVINEGIKLFPNHPSLIIELSCIYKKLGNIYKAVVVYQDAFDLMQFVGISDLDARRYESFFSRYIQNGDASEDENFALICARHAKYLSSIGKHKDAFDFVKNKDFFWEKGFLKKKYEYIGIFSNQFYSVCQENSLLNAVLIPSTNVFWKKLVKNLKQKNINFVYVLGYPKTNTSLKEILPYSDFYDVDSYNLGVSLSARGNVYSPDRQFLSCEDFMRMKYQALKMMDRQDMLGRYRFIEREALFYSMFLSFYSMLKEKQVKILIAGHTPHIPSSFILFETARILGIKVVCFMQNTIIPGFELRSNFFGKRYTINSTNDFRENIFEKLKNYVLSISRKDGEFTEPDYMLRQKEEDKRRGVDLSFKPKFFKYNPQVLDSLNPNMVVYKNKSWQVLGIDFLYNEKSINYDNKDVFIDTLRKFLLNEYKINCSDYNFLVNKYNEYIYFPLHYEPEKTTNPDGGLYYSAYDALVSLRDWVPLDIPIFVKEHYSQFTTALQGFKSRSPYFYRSILALPNVYFIDFNIPSSFLIRGSVLTASQSGTACLEAACSKSKSVIFGYPWFYDCPNIYSFDTLPEYNEFLNFNIFEENEVIEYMNDWVSKYYLYGAYSGSDISNAKKRYPDESYLYSDADLSVKEVVKALEHNGFLELR